MKDNKNNIEIAGQTIPLRALSGLSLKGLWAELIVGYNIYEFSFLGQEMILLESKKGIMSSPRSLAKISERLSEIKSMPCVFMFDTVKTFERDRLVTANVYFVVDSQYCFLPTLLINRKTSSTKSPSLFTPATQRLVLFHLQKRNLNRLSIADISKAIGLSYPTVAKSISHLEQIKVIESDVDENGTKAIKFRYDGRELWDKVQPYLVNPVKKIVFANTMIGIGFIGGINALSHYSMLRPDEVATRVMTAEEYKNEISESVKISDFDGIQPIEIWKYRPITTNEDYVDRLSLALSLRDDHDPRVEKEIENMINEMPW